MCIKRERRKIQIQIHIYIYTTMASLTNNPTPAKRQRTTLKPATIEALEEERAEPIQIGILQHI